MPLFERFKKMSNHWSEKRSKIFGMFVVVDELFIFSHLSLKFEETFQSTPEKWQNKQCHKNNYFPVGIKRHQIKQKKN
jgi:hypothetical protein